MDGTQSKLSPRDAGSLGIQSFKEIMPEESSKRVLLEGLEYDTRTDLWAVTVGFDTTRLVPQVWPTTASIAANPHISALGPPYGDKEIVREFRTLYLKASDGTFVKMEHG